MRRILPLVLVLSLSATASAQDTESAQPDIFDRIDEGFTSWVVVPMFKVLFFDLVFWDTSDAAIRERCLAAGLTADQCTAMSEAEGRPPIVYCEAAGASASQCAALDGALDEGAERSAVIAACAAHASDLDEAQCDELAHASDAGNAYCAAVGPSPGACRDVTAGNTLPFIVLWLVLGALFFTFRFGFINLRAFGHAIAVTRGKYDDPEDTGEVSHFQALSSALSATVGLGNIAGVAVAVGAGGPGAVFWMIVAGFLGMSSKFAECTLGQLYREVDDQGHIMGGPMRYLAKGLSEMKMAGLGRVLAVVFAVMCIGGSLGGGNMFQANQSYAQVSKVLPFLEGSVGSLVYGLLLAALVGVVIIGGIKRIGNVAGYIVPLMCGVYLLAGLFVVFTNLEHVGPALGSILGEAFTPEAGFGGLLGSLVTGFQRAAFSNEAGIGSASIAHSAASTEEPVREGIVALLEPFIDTILVCTMTGLVIVITGSYLEPGDGVVMTSNAFSSVIDWFPVVLSFAVFFFAFSTMISWSYYGERCWSFLFGQQSAMVYRVIFLIAVVLGSVLKLGSVIDFSDLMVLGMAFPNILGVVLLSGKVGAALDDYWKRFKAGEMNPVEPGSEKKVAPTAQAPAKKPAAKPEDEDGDGDEDEDED